MSIKECYSCPKDADVVLRTTKMPSTHYCEECAQMIYEALEEGEEFESIGLAEFAREEEAYWADRQYDEMRDRRSEENQ